jgi:hypothetical protein
MKKIVNGTFLWLCFLACSPTQKDTNPIQILWKDDKAVGLIIETETSPDDSVEVSLAYSKDPMLGQYRVENHRLVFEPLIPLTRGMEYVITKHHREMGRIKIPASLNPPELLAIYPSCDTVPENLLKIYLEFSHPMREGQSPQKMFWSDEAGDTVRGVFLHLQSELWNNDRTILTMWLDPGRIKRDLQPNRKFGTPLRHGKKYTLHVDSLWEDALGAVLGKRYTRHFYVTLRDSVSPETTKWQITVPGKGTHQAIVFNFFEPLDHILLKECFSVFQRDKKIEGTIQVMNKDQRLSFTPDEAWGQGAIIRVESRLEDLAGNNLSRTFDRDLNQDHGKVVDREWVKIPIRLDTD